MVKNEDILPSIHISTTIHINACNILLIILALTTNYFYFVVMRASISRRSLPSLCLQIEEIDLSNRQFVHAWKW